MGLVFGPQARRAVPTGLVKIDSSHPAVTALNAYVLHGSRQGADADLCSGGLAPWIEPSLTNSVAGMTSFGPSRRFPARGTNQSSVGGDFVLTKTSNPVAGTGDCTIAAQFIFNTALTPGRYTNVFGQSNAAVNKYFDVYVQSSASNLVLETGGATLNVIIGGPVAGVPYTLFAVRTGTVLEVFLNGISVNTVTDNSSIYDSAFNARYGAWGTGFPAGCDDFDLLWSAGWNRALSLGEIGALTQDPYGLLVPVEGEMPTLFMPAAGGGFIPAWALNSNLPVIGTGTY